MSIELVMPSSHLILCHPLLLPPSIFPSTRVFSSESALIIRWAKYWSVSISPSNEYTELISFRIDWQRRKRQPTPVFLPGESCGQRNLVGCCPWGRSESDKRLIFLLVLLMPQARPHSFKALAGKVLTLPSEDSFLRPRGLLISPLSTGLCPPAASLRSCTERWPPSTARTGEAPPLAGGPVCLNPPIQGQSHWGQSQGMGPGWPHSSAFTILEFSVVEQGASFFSFAPGSAAGW